MKTCSKCGELKKLIEFSFNKNTKDGLSFWCKSCIKHYKRSKNGVEARKRYQRSTNGKENNKKYNQSEKGKSVAKKANKKHRKLNPEKIKANSAVYCALRAGNLKRPTHCSCCGVKCKPHAHHWSYDKKHWLNVIWLCGACHRDVHL